MMADHFEISTITSRYLENAGITPLQLAEATDTAFAKEGINWIGNTNPLIERFNSFNGLYRSEFRRQNNSIACNFWRFLPGSSRKLHYDEIEKVCKLRAELILPTIILQALIGRNVSETFTNVPHFDGIKIVDAGMWKYPFADKSHGSIVVLDVPIERHARSLSPSR